MRDGRGVVITAPGAPAHIVPIVVDPPGADEVLVRVVANGICHSDLWAIEHGNWGSPFPMLLGHEAAGIVEETGTGVAHVTPGDRVLLAWAVPCGVCPACRRDRPRGCDHAWKQPARLHTADGLPLVGTLSIGGLATHTVVSAAQVIPVPTGLDLEAACLLGCGASTGIGAAINTGAVQSGDAIAVIGLGGIGLSALQGARLAGAERLIAVDRVASKFDIARSLGATDVIDAGAEDSVAAVRALTGGAGVDVSFEATGNAAVVAQAVAMLTRGGTAVAIGVPAPDSTITLDWGQDTVGAAYPRKASLKITDGGDPLAEDFAAWLEAAADGRLDLGALVTTVSPFTDDALAESFRAMLAGEVIRTVIRFD